MSDYPFYENCLRCDKPVSDAEFNKHNIRICDQCRPHYFLIEPPHQNETALKKHLCIQLHLPSSDDRVQNLLLYILNATLPTTSWHFVALSSFEGGKEDNVDYATMNFATENVPLLWNLVKARLATENLLPVAIVTCEGNHGWDDYLLLHSFDPNEKLDVLNG